MLPPARIDIRGMCACVSLECELALPPIFERQTSVQLGQKHVVLLSKYRLSLNLRLRESAERLAYQLIGHIDLLASISYFALASVVYSEGSPEEK